MTSVKSIFQRKPQAITPPNKPRRSDYQPVYNPANTILPKPRSRIRSRIRLLSYKRQGPKTGNEPKEKTNGIQLATRVATWYDEEKGGEKRPSGSRKRLAKELPREVLVIFRTIKWVQDQDARGYVTPGNRNGKEGEQPKSCSGNVLMNASNPGCCAVEHIGRGVRSKLIENKPCNHYNTSHVASIPDSICLPQHSLQRLVEGGLPRIASGLEMASKSARTPLTPVLERVRSRQASTSFSLPWSHPTKPPTTIKEAVQGLIHQKTEENSSRSLSPASRFCGRCDLPVPYFAFSDEPPTQTCKHSANTCMECLARWVGEEIRAKGRSRVVCPECLEVLEFVDVQRVATSADLQRYVTSSCFFE